MVLLNRQPAFAGHRLEQVLNITFYLAGKQCNNSGNATGDQSYTSTAVS